MAKILILLSLFLFTAFGEEIFAVKSWKTLRGEDVIRQSHEESCGASSLATLFNLYGYNFKEKDLIKDLNTTDVVNFNQLIKASEKNGFKAKGYSIPKEVFEKIQFPVIARLARNKEYPHFVVVKRFDGDFLVVLDPNFGKFVVLKEEFFSNWLEDEKGYILVVLPKESRNLKSLTIDFNNQLYLH